jgi:4,5-dihydroxyphthalate decarboxylase
MTKNSHARLALTIASWDYDRARALIDGRVDVEGCEVTYLSLGPEECFHRAWAGEFDVSELGISSFLVGLSRGESPFIGIPVFLSRSFRHSGIYIRDDRGIDRPEALRGKRVGVPAYEMAAAVWIRGLLNDEYGVAPADMRWVNGGLEVPGRESQFKLRLPDGFPLEPAPKGATLNQMFADGELDALVSARAPSCFEAGAPHVRRLFPDFREAERAYFERTHIFPIMHVCGVRRTLLEEHPWLAVSLVKAYGAAKAVAEADLREVAALKIELPWVLAEYEATVRAMGTDYWPYGVDANRATLEALLTYSYDQGLTPRRLTVEEMFAPTTLHTSRI